MAFTTKLNLVNEKFYQSANGTLDLSGATKLGDAEYLTGMSAVYGATTIPDVAFVTGQTANKLDTPIFTGYTAATQTMYNDVGDPTGFVDNENIVVSYNSTNRTITLSAATGNVEYYYKGVKHTLSNPWTSDAHTSDSQAWFLYSTDGETFAWSTAVWDYDDVQVAVRPANTSWAIREIHGLMPWETHQELHRTIGTYRVSGFGFTDGTYNVEPPASDADNTPGFEAGTVADEDLQTSLAAWVQGSYTQLHFTSTGTINFSTAQSNLFAVGTTYPRINDVVGGTFNWSAGNEMVHGEYANWYVIRIPVTSDAGSQLYRAVVLQPQHKYSSLAAAQAENPLSINLGDFTNLAPEYVFVERITLHANSGYTTTGKVGIPTGGLSILTGAKFNQTSTTPGAGTVTAGNVSVTPFAPFGDTNMQDLSDTYAQCLIALDAITDLALTGTTGSYIGTSGRNVCIDAIGTIVLGAALTGTTNGLTDDGRIAKLGAPLTENTTINLSTFDLKFADDSVQYTADYSGTYVARSLPDVGYVTGLTNGLDTRIDALETWSGTTETRIDNLETWSGTTETRVDNLETWSGTTETRIDNLETWSGTTNTRLDTIESQYITGGTSGLLADGAHDLKLGGEITENTTLFGSYVFGVNANQINLTGATSGINLGGSGLYIPATLTGSGDLLCIDSGTKQVGLTSLSAFGGITGGTNGVIDCGNQNLGLGGALCADTSICGDNWSLELGTKTSPLCCATISTTDCVSLTSDNISIVFNTGMTVTDSRNNPEGITYDGDYSTTFVDNSLVTKLYVDTVAAGLDPKSAVLVATTGETIDLSGGTFGGVIDGVTLSDGDRVLVKNQTNGAQNGIYDYVIGTNTFVRSSDFDGSPVGEVTEGALIPVLSGSTNINSSWILITKNPITVGTTPLEFTKFSQLLDVSAGDGISISTIGETKTICVDLASNSGLCFVSTQLSVDSAIAGTALSWSSGVLNVCAASGGTAGISVKYDGSENLVVNAADISNALGGVLTGSTNGLTDLNGVVCLGGALSTATTICGDDTFTLTYQDDAITNKRGILYAADYCATFVDRSLVDKAYVVRYTTGLTSGLDTRLDVIEAVYVTGATGGICKTDAHTVSLTAANQAILTAALTGVTGTHLGTSGRNVCLDTAATTVIDSALTGSTNGLTDDGRIVKLGGLLTDVTTELSGATGTEFKICSGDILMYSDSGDLALSSGGAALSVPNANVSVNADTSINVYSNGSNIKVCAVAGCVDVCGASAINLLSGTDFSIYFDGSAVITDNTSTSGLTYADDYSATFVDNSLITKKYVTTYVTGITDGLETRVEALETWSGTTETRVDNLETWSGTTETRVDTIESQYITGGTSGLLPDGSHNLKLGGEITETTTLFGVAQTFNINVSDLNLTGSTVDITGVVTLQSTPATGEATDAVLVWNSTDKQIKQIPATSLGEDNNDYSMLVVTSSTGLTTGSPYVILVNHTAAVTLTLPAAPFDGQAFKIKDAAADALTYNITVDGNGNDIDVTGTSTATINTDGGALELVFNAALDMWFVMSFVN